MSSPSVPAGGASGPSVVALIPARGGSKGVPSKNLRRIGGVPLVARAVHAARAAGIEAIWVSTDDPVIADVARTAGAGVIIRPVELAGDDASSESALLHALDELAEGGVLPRTIAFLQATSPFIDAAALARAVDRVDRGSDDVVLAAFPTYAFLWSVDGGGAAAVNHDQRVRPRRQDREPHWQETGAFYVLSASGFLANRFRFFGRIGVEAVEESTAVEIDDAAQLAAAERIGAAHRLVPAVLDVDAVITDFDGVHTDDRAWTDADGAESVQVSRADGLGVEMLRDAGVPVLIMSRERNRVVAARAAKLQVEVLQAVDDKAAALTAWAQARHIPLERIAYVGNDVNDAGALRLVGWPIVVPGAHPSVLPLARHVLTTAGGLGAVREVAEMVLAARATGRPRAGAVPLSGGVNQERGDDR